MPLFEIDASSGELVPFRSLVGGADIYESEIEGLLSSNIEDLIGDSVLPIARQPNIRAGGRPDIVALDKFANVVGVEVKRDVDRNQLAQCLEYAGWARNTSLDEIAAIYHRGKEEFFIDWQDFTESDVPEVLSRAPRLVLVARDFHGRTESALEYLIENHVPVTVIRVSIYEDASGRRFVDVEGENEPEFAPAATDGTRVRVEHKIGGRRIRVSDLLDAELLEPGDELLWEGPRLGDVYQASVTENGGIQLADGATYASPSRAAVVAADIPAYDGWYAWKVTRLGDVTLNDVRARLLEQAAKAEE